MNPQDILTAMEAPIRKTLEIAGHPQKEIDQIAPAMIARILQTAITHFVATLEISEAQLQELRDLTQESPQKALKLAISYAKSPDQFEKSVDLAYYEIIQTYLQELLPSLSDEEQQHLQRELEKLSSV